MLTAVRISIVPALLHLVDWVDHHSGGSRDPARRPARLTYYGPAAAGSAAGAHRSGTVA